MFSHQLMCHLMDHPSGEENNKKDEKHYFKKGLAGILNYVNASVSNEKKAYYNT